MKSTVADKVRATEPVVPDRASRPHVEDPFALVIFGATGALTASKLLPALFRLWRDQFLPRPFAVIGLGRRDKDDDKFREDAHRDVLVSPDTITARNSDG